MYPESGAESRRIFGRDRPPSRLSLPAYRKGPSPHGKTPQSQLTEVAPVILLGPMRRRDFIRTSLLGSAALLTCGTRLGAQSGAVAAYPNKRERMLAWLEGRLPEGYTPAAFFMHFDEYYRQGATPAQKHLEYFEATDMDFVKIQYERDYTPVGFLNKPSDWSKLTPHGLDFYEPSSTRCARS